VEQETREATRDARSPFTKSLEKELSEGLGGALQTLARQPLGSCLLGVVALGLVAYGLFMLSVARYRHINTGGVR
jgi:hypothetical protein